MANKPLKSLKFPGLDDTYTFTQVDADLETAGDAADAKKTGDEISNLKADISDLSDTALAAYVTDTATGAIASFPDGADGVPVKSLTVEIEPVQSGSGDPSPTNVRPISGWSEVKVTRTGKNLLTPLYKGFVTTSGWSANNQVVATRGFFIKEGTYILTTPNVSNPLYVTETSDEVTRIPDGYQHVYSSARLITIPKDGLYSIQLNINSAVSDEMLATYNSTFHLELGSTASSYSPYQGETYTIDLDGTRYGGTLDVGTGVLTVDKALVDLGALNWSYSSGRMNYDTAISDAKAPSSNADAIVGMCSIYPILSANEESDKHIAMNTSKQLRVYDSAYTDAATFKTAMSGQQLVYELAEHVSVQLDPETVTTLLGQNAVFADCGDVAVGYRADTRLYIDKLLNA